MIAPPRSERPGAIPASRDSSKSRIPKRKNRLRNHCASQPFDRDNRCFVPCDRHGSRGSAREASSSDLCYGCIPEAGCSDDLRSLGLKYDRVCSKSLGLRCGITNCVHSRGGCSFPLVQPPQKKGGGSA